MSTLASLASMLGQVPNIRPWDVAMRSQNEADTGLLQLQEMKREQETAARTRQFLKEHPEILLGQGGGSTIGSLMQPSPQGAGPRPDPMAPQGVPGRNAGVSPQGGGPIPPDVMAQTMPQVTPPQSTIASLGPAGQPQGQMQALQNRYLMDLARTSPDAAMKVQQLMQGQEDAQMRRYGERLDMGVKIAEAVGREAQTATDQASWDRARANVAQFNPQAAAQMQDVYSPEAKAAFVKRAVGVKDNALLQLETWKNQIEMQKIGVQLAQAGYQGLGDDVTGIIRGLSEEQVKQFGGRTTPAAIAYATEEARKLKPVPGQTPEVTTELRKMGKDPWKAQPEDLTKAGENIQARQVEQRGAEGLAGAQATAQANQQARLDKTVSEAFGERTTKIYDAQTGQTVDARMKVKDYEALPAGRVKELSTNQTEQMEQVNNSVPIVAQLQTHIDKIYGPGGVLARMTPDERADLAAVPGRWATQYAQKYPEVTQAQRFINSNAGALARALAGEKGAMAEGDVARAKEMLPNLETTLRVWPPANIGIQSPDTRAVALGSMNSIVDMINGRVRTILGNEQFTHPKLHRYETADDAQQATGSPGTPPAVAPPELPIPPLTRLNPNLPPAQGPRGAPPQQRYVPPAPQAAPAAPAPTTRQAPPTATSTPAPAPSAPAPRTTPGRQSQAPTGRRGVELARASGIKVMDAEDIRTAMAQTGRSRAEVIKAARARGYTVYSGGTALA